MYADKELLSEQPQERQWQAEHGLARISLPPKSSAIVYGSDPSRTLKGTLMSIATLVIADHSQVICWMPRLVATLPAPRQHV
jgi:hypothetical protein